MDNMENNTVETVETEIVDLEPADTVVPTGKFNLDSDVGKGIAIIGGCTILVWEAGKFVCRKIAGTKLVQGAKAKIKSIGKKQAEPEVVQDENTEETVE